VTTGIAAGLALAIAASLALNTGFLLQHSGVSEAPPVTLRRPTATVVGLLRQRVWLLGLVLGTAGWAMHVAALSRAPLSLVQAFVAGGLALLAPIATRWFGQTLTRPESIAVAVMAIGLAALALGAHDPRNGEALPGAGLGLFLAGSAVAAGVVATRRAAVPLAVAGGLLYGAADTAIKALTLVSSHHGLGAAITSAWLPFAIVFTAGAFFAFQRALQLGPPVTSIALMTAATYVVSIAAGLLVLSEPIGHGAIGIVHLAAFAAVVGAACVLAPAQARLADQRGGTYSGIRRSPSTVPGRPLRTRGSVSAGIRPGSWAAGRRSRWTGRSP
jgi:drug/metabolite transporter (DMT)-like permease